MDEIDQAETCIGPIVDDERAVILGSEAGNAPWSRLQMATLKMGGRRRFARAAPHLPSVSVPLGDDPPVDEPGGM